jgi:two-component system sensor histidine kinase DevS
LSVGGRDVDEVSEVEGGRSRLRSLMSALSELGTEQWASARVERLLGLSVEIVDAEHAVLVVDGEDGAVAPVLFSTDDGAAVQELRSLLRPHLTSRLDGPPFRPEVVTVPDATPRKRQRPVLQVPLSISSGRTGRLYVVGRRGRAPFSADDAELVGEFAKMAARSVESAQQGQESRQQVRWLNGLTLITRALLEAGADEMSVWQEIADRVQQLARARTVTISTVSEEDRDLLEVRVAAGVGAEQLPGLVYPAEGSLAARAMSTGTWQVGRGEQNLTVHTRVGLPIGPSLAIPLSDDDGPRGAVVLSRHRGQAPFDPTDVVMAHDFANQAMLAVELAETRAAEQSLADRTALEEVTGTFQDRTIQRLFAASLTVEAALERRPEPWLAGLHAELSAIIDDARSTLEAQYGRTHETPEEDPTAPE